MREIKFRAKRVDNGEWVHGYYCNVKVGHPTITIEEGGSHRVDSETVGQYIGHKDVLRVKIFEGDVVEHDDPMVGDGRYSSVVVFDEDYSMFCFDSDAPNDINFYHDKEIIGNIHQTCSTAK